MGLLDGIMGALKGVGGMGGAGGGGLGGLLGPLLAKNPGGLAQMLNMGGGGAGGGVPGAAAAAAPGPAAGAEGGGFHGFLQGLGDKLGLPGGGPQLSIQEKPDIMDERLGAIHQMPTYTPQKDQSFLQRFNTAGDDGTSMRDRLYAAASAMRDNPQGDPMAYLQGVRDRNQKQMDRGKLESATKKKSAAFKAAYQDGKFNPQVYAQLAGDDLDPGDLAGLDKAFRPDYGFMNANHGLYRTDPRTGGATEVVHGERDLPPGYEPNPAGGWRPVKGGPYDPEQVGSLATVRRRALVDNPLPVRGRAGGKTPAGIPSPGAGFVIRP